MGDNTKRFILFGHVDHGKSTLAGHLLYKVGKFTEHDVERAKQDSIVNKMPGWKWAYLLDSDIERVKGKTHEYTIESFDFNGSQYELLDTPGHKSFIRQMISAVGTHSNITGVLVTSVIENEFISGMENGNTKEHLIIARGSGIKNLIVCLNKIDAINFDQVKINRIKEELHYFIKSLNFKKVVYLGVSAYNGDNITNIITNVDNMYETPEEIGFLNNTLSSKKITCKCKFLQVNQVVCKGYSCIMHTKELEVNIEIYKIKNKHFIKTGDIVEFKILTEYPIEYTVNQKILFRNSDKTIAFGVII